MSLTLEKTYTYRYSLYDYRVQINYLLIYSLYGLFIYL